MENFCEQFIGYLKYNEGRCNFRTRCHETHESKIFETKMQKEREI